MNVDILMTGSKKWRGELIKEKVEKRINTSQDGSCLTYCGKCRIKYGPSCDDADRGIFGMLQFEQQQASLWRRSAGVRVVEGETVAMAMGWERTAIIGSHRGDMLVAVVFAASMRSDSWMDHDSIRQIMRRRRIFEGGPRGSQSIGARGEEGTVSATEKDQ